MQSDIKKLYTVAVLYALALLPPLFVTSKLISNLLLAIITVVAAIAAFFLIRKRLAPDIRYREATLICFVSALVAVMLLYLLGLSFGFGRVGVYWSTVYTYVLPIIAAITAGEILRRILLSQKKPFATAVAFIAFVILDVALFAEKNAFRDFSAFMSAMGLVVLPALASNLLYHGLSSNYGALCVIPYRLVVGLYSYLLPFRPAVPNALLAFLKIIFPLILLWFIRLLYKKRTLRISKRSRIAQIVSTVLCLVVMALSVSFIAGMFDTKLIVVASESMSGELEKGDVVIYDTYDGQTVETNQIILFDRNGTTVIHRVVEVERINGAYRYYTKGDANEGMDMGYITDADIVGVAKLKIRYLGYPTVWLHDLFK